MIGSVKRLEPLERRVLFCTLHSHPAPVEIPFIPVDGGPEAAADIVWVNRGQPSDGFDSVFGANAETARGVIDAVIVAFERMIGSFNYSDGSSNFNLTVQMGEPGNGASAGLGQTLGGKPKSGTITMGSGSNGQGGGWYIDPTPHDHSEFRGPIVNAYSGDATPGGPADGLGDFYTVAAAEITHVLGLYGSGLPLWASRTTNTGVPDTAEGNGIGTFWVFQGPSIKHLLTSNNAGSQNFGSAIHGAGPGVPVNFGGQTYIGSQDIGNAIYEFSRRYIPSQTFSLMFKDAFGYSSVDPAQFGTFYTMRDPSSGLVSVRGGTSSNDIINISASGGSVTLSVDIGNDVPGTGSLPGAGNLPAFVTTFNAGDISSIVIDAGDGADTINVNSLATSVPLVINSDFGSDTINLNDVPAGATVTVNAGFGDDTISLGGGNILANLLGNITIDGQDGSDTLVFNDASSSGNINYTIDSSTFTMTGGSPIGFSALEGLRLNANAFDNTISVLASGFGRPITVNAGGGNDSIVLGTGNLSALPATVTIDGQAGSDTVRLDDSVNSDGQFYGFEAANMTRAGFGPLLHSNIETLRLTADSGNSAIFINNTSATTSTIVSGGAGSDVVNVVGTHASSPAFIESSVDADTVKINEDLSGTAEARFTGPVTRLSQLQINDGGIATMSSGASNVLVMELLSITGSGRLDIDRGALIIDYLSGSPISSVKNLLSSGYNAGAWNGSGIMSSLAAADATHKASLGYAEATDVFSSFPATFAGLEVDDTSILICQTIYGDTNLDGAVNLGDFNRLAGGFGSGSNWSQGNFNYDTSVSLADFNLLAGNFGLSAAPDSDDPFTPLTRTRDRGSELV